MHTKVQSEDSKSIGELLKSNIDKVFNKEKIDFDVFQSMEKLKKQIIHSTDNSSTSFSIWF
jgi:ribosomal 50S subunit-associated protein YjgA (DUF615 family)